MKLKGQGGKCKNFNESREHDLYFAPTFEDLHHCLVMN